MICKNESELKRDFSLYGAHAVTLLAGSEPALITSWRTKILSSLQGSGGEVEKLDGAQLDVDTLCGDAQLVPMLGGARIFRIDALDTARLSPKDQQQLCELLSDFPEGNAIVITLAPGVLDVSRSGATSFPAGKGVPAAAKKLISAADKGGVAACLDRRTPAQLRTAMTAYCKKQGCELPPESAERLQRQYGNDIGTLLHECEKLCFYRPGGTITPQDVSEVCLAVPEGDIFAIAAMMLRADAAGALGEIGRLLARKTAPEQVLSILSGAFCDYARAAAAHTAGKSGEEMAADFRYPANMRWKAEKAMRDTRRVDIRRINAACTVLCEAEFAVKSTPADAQVLLETAVVRGISALRGDIL